MWAILNLPKWILQTVLRYGVVSRLFICTLNFTLLWSSVLKLNMIFLTLQYYYSVRDISIGGLCVCNGHASSCGVQNPNEPYKQTCKCEHNTCGPYCDRCCPGFVQVRSSSRSISFWCEILDISTFKCPNFESPIDFFCLFSIFNWH